MATFTLFADPGHAWAKVPRKLLHELGIADRITRFSYERGEDVYLEEDCDLGIFYAAYTDAHGVAPKFTEQSSERSSRIRSYSSYSPTI